MIPIQTISFLITTCATMGYTHPGGYASRWYTKTVHDYGKPPELPGLRRGREPIAIVPTQAPKMPSTYAPQVVPTQPAEYNRYTPVVDYYDHHPVDRRSFPFESGTQNLFVFTDPVEGEPFQVSYVQQPPVQNQMFDQGSFMPQRNRPFNSKSGVYPATYNRRDRQPSFKSRHSNTYMNDDAFFANLMSSRGGFDHRELRGLKDNVRNIILDALLSKLMQEWHGM